MPLSSASTKKPAASASDTRLEIVMVKRSLAAANAIRAGNSSKPCDVEDHGITRMILPGSAAEVGASTEHSLQR